MKTKTDTNPIASLAPIDTAAARILSNRGVIKEEDAVIEDRIVELVELKLQTAIRLAEIEADLAESTRQYHEYGISSKPETYKSTRIEQAKLRHCEWLCNHEIDRLKRNRNASRATEATKHFVALAKQELPAEQFWSMLRRAEVLAASRVAHA